MRIFQAGLPDILVIEPKVFEDERGIFYESYNEKLFRDDSGLGVKFVQDNHSKSLRNVLRGLHFQSQRPQGKLICVTQGEIFDVAVDIRKASKSFGHWVGEILSAENRKQVWVPPGFAHGFLTMSETAEVLYKVTDYYMPQFERCIAWNDPDLAINWPLNGCNPILSSRDMAGSSFYSGIA